ncbi:TlpA disulfide reductase family protein [Marinifilum sp. D714]|uniref:TlpA family protein disulfide reductase n=1 Tax=Marinifilum sp. D714 TaxID=2937523 RepID=UPI0027C1F8F2|nr:TlpA disulfide reductase family protein [Marinifilum sp. D714]MDQ2177943.1 TlpA family protein disulfide reductase [Marinifilum sp. D714]
MVIAIKNITLIQINFMRHYLLYIFFIIAIISFPSCKQSKPLQANKAIISGEVINFSQHKNKTWIEVLHPDIFAQSTPFKQIKIDSTGKFRYQAQLISPGLCWGIYNKWFPFVISPGDSLHFTIDANIWNDKSRKAISKEDYIQISGTVKEDYNKIRNFQEWASDSLYTGSLRQSIDEATKTKSPEEFKEFIFKIESNTKSIIEKFGKEFGAGPLYYDILNAENQFRNLDHLMRYRWSNPMMKNVKTEDIELPKNYFSFLKNYNMNNRDFFVLQQSDVLKELLNLYLFQDKELREIYFDIRKNKENAKVPNNYFSNQANHINNQTHGITKDLLLHLFAMRNFKDTPQNSSIAYSSVKDLIQDSYIANHLTEEYKKLTLKNQNTIKSKPSEHTALDSIIDVNKGQILYVDFWAPWCAPCLNEMKPSQKLKKKLNGKPVQFVYLACRTNKDKWETTIANKNISGINVLLSDKDYQTLSKRYNIQGIPHFLLIDKSGKVVNQNAPRPSNENIETHILKLK